MEMNYCRRCGSALSLQHSGAYKCNNNHIIYSNASPASALWIVNDKNEVLVAVRAQEPGMGKLDSPGGFNDGAETFEDSISRELQEELGLTPNNYTTPQYILSAIDSYGFGSEDLNVLCAVYWARIVGNPKLAPADDVAEARFVPIADINLDDIYFDAPRAGFVALKKLLGIV